MSTRKPTGKRKAARKAATKKKAPAKKAPAKKAAPKKKARTTKKTATKKTARKASATRSAAARRAGAAAARRKPATRRKAPARRSATTAARERSRTETAPAVQAAPTALTAEQALEIARGFERKVRDHYAGGAAVIRDPQGVKVFAALAREEQGHIDYIEAQLARLRATGSVGTPTLATALPRPEWVREAEARHRQTAPIRRVAEQNEVELLKTALKLEQDAAGFYHDLVSRVPQGDRPMFEQFLDIEDGHLAIVQSELDSVQGLGYWFDVPEFALEAQ